MAAAKKKGCLPLAFAGLGVALGTFYLSNLGGGVIEVIPDNIPVAGNIDELIASVLLLYCAQFLGLPGPATSALRK